MRNWLLLLLLAFPLLYSCKQKNQSLARVWFYNDTWYEGDDGDFYRRFDRPMESGLSAANFIDLQPDGSFHSYLARYTWGKWQEENGNLILVDHNRQSLKLKILGLDDGRLALSDNLKHRLLPFSGYKNHFTNTADNPFGEENNQWRIKAEQHESDKQIEDRLKNHFRFWEKYFAWGLNNDLSVLPVADIPSPLEMYGNGFKLTHHEYQSPQWKKFFYDSSDSWKAYEKMYYLMYQKKVNWPDEKNRFKAFISAFSQMQSWF